MVSARSDGGSEKVPSGNSNAACGIWALKNPRTAPGTLVSWLSRQAGCFCCGAPDPLFVSCPLPRYPHVALPLSLLRLSSVDLLVLMLVVAVSAVVGGICIGVWGALSGAWGFRSGWLVRCAAGTGWRQRGIAVPGPKLPRGRVFGDLVVEESTGGVFCRFL